MNSSAFCKRILLPLFLPYSLFIGCSAVGAIIGGASRPARDDRVTTRLGLDSISLGTEIQLVRFDKNTLEGEYKGLALYRPRLYATTYDTAVARSSYRGFIPGLDQRITLRAAGKVDEVYFKGIDRGEVLFQPVSGRDTLAVAAEVVESLEASDSLPMQGWALRNLIRDGTMPGRRVILLGGNLGDQTVPYESIEIVLLKGNSSGAMTGFLIGAAVDVTVLIIAAITVNQAESDCNNTATGCMSSSQNCSGSRR